MSFVKSATTSTSVINSKNELEKMLRRYGASAFQVSHDYAGGTAVVSFIVPDSPVDGAQKIPVRIPVDIRRVHRALLRLAPIAKKAKPTLEQAERVAWRNLILWVDAALASASLGLQTISESLLAHAVVGEGGERVIEMMERAQQQLGPGIQRLLTAGAEQ